VNVNVSGDASHEPMAMTVGSILATVDDRPASYLAAARRLAALPAGELRELRVTALSTFTIELVVPYLAVECARRGHRLEATVGPFGQLEQQVLDPASVLHASAPHVVLFAPRVEDVAPELADGFMRLDAQAVAASVAAYVARIAELARALRERSTARIVVWNQPPLRRLAAGLADTSLEASQQAAVASLNASLAAAVRAIPGASVFDAARVATELGTDRWFDAKMAALARCPIGPSAQIAVARRLARQLRATMEAPCKCLVLDLDNTLWGGVIGEDGLGGIALGDTYPGNAFKQFQRVLASYRDRGVLLAIASKNNEADVDDVFANHTDMVLRREDFAARQIHWNDKASSLRAIAKELDIGVDALAFFDDNPVERAWVREQLPEVTVIDVPKDPLGYADALDGSGAFDHLIVTAEDRLRAEQYRAEVQRKELETTATSVEDFLRALEMKIVIGSIDAATTPRVVQLLGKTNQFNVTTRRHDEAALARMLDGGAVALWMRITDRYGDNGLVGVAIAVPDEASVYRLDSFLMSCRVLGRKAEQALLHVLCRRARARGAETLLGEFIPTKKNAPAATFFADAGFAPHDAPNHWRMDLGGAPAAPAWVEIVEQP
jgi:FkbH-like protein